MADLMLHHLQTNAEFLEEFVKKCLPLACRDWTSPSTKESPNGWFFYKLVSGVCYVTQNMCTYTATTIVTAKVEDVL